MKKTIIGILLTLVMLCSLSTAAFAETIPGANWTVTCTTDGNLVSSFDNKTVAETLSGLQPGDDVTIHIQLTNSYKYGVDFYMLNEVLETLEESSTQGGGYSYLLTYTATNGAAREVFNSETVGGEKKNNAVPQGLKEVNSTLANYFFLGTVESGKSASIALKVTLDGETQGNDYQNALAKLRMRFAIEIMSPDKKVVRTGDERNMTAFYIAMAASGALFLALGIDGLRQHRLRKGETA